MGILAGFINTMAGGGSLIAIPTLMLLGLDANVANGTTRLSIVTQSGSGALGFYREGKLDTKAIPAIVTPTVIGALLGAGAAAIAPTQILEPVILVILVTMALLMLVRPKLVLPPEGETPRAPLEHKLSLLGLFAAGLYGGFIQGGVGIVLLGVIGGILRYDPVRANALKMVCTLIFGTFALGVFVLADQVAWVPASVLAVSTVIGSQLGVRFAVKANAKVLRGFIFVCVAGASIAIALR